MSREHNPYECQKCHEPVRVGWHLPSVCKECGAAFDVRPSWMTTAVFVVAALLAVVCAALMRMVVPSTPIDVLFGIVMGFVLFNVIEIILFKLGVLRLTNVNAPSEGLQGVVLHPTDSDALAKAESAARAKNYAGRTDAEKIAQAEQLRESVKLVKSLRGGKGEPKGSVRNGRSQRNGESRNVRCRFRRVKADEATAIRAWTTIVLKSTSMEAPSSELVAKRIMQGSEYYLVFEPEGVEEGARQNGKSRPIGAIAITPREGAELRLDMFCLVRDARGNGYARTMMRLVAQRAHKLGSTYVTLRVNQNNYQAMNAFESLGFRHVGEHRSDVLYELEL